jgi:autotransporter-associated beta strand protein
VKGTLAAAMILLVAGGAAAQTTVRFGSLKTLTGISDLDLSGNFAYAIDVGGPGRTVGGLAFDPDQNAAAASANENNPGTQASPATPGFYPCMNAPQHGGNDPNLGDENLDELLQYCRNDSADFRVIQLDVTPDTRYKLQVLVLSTSNNDRRFDLAVGPDPGAANADLTWKAGNLAVDSLMEQTPQVWTYEFTATTNSLWINCGKEVPQTGADPNPCLSAITLENLSDPGGTLVTYPGPAGEPESTDYSVSVNGKPLFIYTSWQYDRDEATQYINGRPVSAVSFCSFDFGGGPVTITVEVKALELSKNFVVVKPLARGITPAVTNGVFSFTISEPGQITVQPGGTVNAPSMFKPLHIFANPLEINPPSPGDPDVIYYGPGVHEAVQINLASSKTLYVAGGAVVYAAASGLEKPFVKVDNANNVTVRGRGILCGRKRVLDQRAGAAEVRIVDVNNSDHVTIEGLVLRETEGWTCFIRDGSDYATVDNVKIIAADASSDGFVLSGGSHSVVRNSFCHNSDDAFETKAWPPDATDILFENNIAWSTVASAFAHSAETEANVSNVTFRNCTVINAAYNLSHRGVIGVSVNCTRNIRDYLFENITIEYIQHSSPFDSAVEMPPIRVQNNQEALNKKEVNYEEVNPDPGYNRPRGTINNVTFRNINVISATCQDVVVIADAAASPISNVTFENVMINGTCLVPGDPRIWTNQWVGNLSVVVDAGKETGEYTWRSDQNNGPGDWTNTANWNDGSVFKSGNDSTLRFCNGNDDWTNGDVNITNNVPGALTARNFVLQGRADVENTKVTVGTPATTLTLTANSDVGDTAEIQLNGYQSSDGHKLTYEVAMNIDLKSNLRFQNNSDSYYANNIFTGIIGESTPGRTVTKNDASEVTLTGVNIYTGATIIHGGTLALGASGSIASSVSVALMPGAVFKTSAKASFAMPATQTYTFHVAGAGTGASGRIQAASLDISNAKVVIVANTLDDPVYVLAEYTSLTGSAFAVVTHPLPDGYSINYKYNGNQIALVTATTPTYASWATTNDIDGQPAAGDSDNDGVDNAVEMLLGGLPATQMDAALLPTLALVSNPAGVEPAGNYFEFTYRRSDLAVSAGVSAACQTNTGLGPAWTTAQDGVNGVVVLVDNDYTPYGTATDRVRVYVPRGTNARLFARLHVTVP